MADHPILDMFGDITPSEGGVLQEIGAISGAGGGQGYNPNLNQLPGNSGMLTGQNAMPGLPQTASRSYNSNVAGAPPQMSQDRTKLLNLPSDYPSSASGMAISAQYGSLTSNLCGTDSSTQQQSPVAQQRQQHRYPGMITTASGSHQYRSQQYPYPSNEQQTQFDGMQYSAASSLMPPVQQARSMATPQQAQQYPNSWSSSSQAQSLNYMSPQRMPVRQQQQHPYMDFNTQTSNEPQTSASHQQMTHYPGANASSNIPNQQHIGRTSSLSASSQMGMYQQGFPQSSQQNNALPNYGGAQSHPSMSQQISGYPQTSQPQRPSSSYYSSSGLGSRPTTPQQQSYSHHLPQQQQTQQGQYPMTNHHPANSQPSDAAAAAAAVRLQHYQNSSSAPHVATQQNGSMGQNTYYTSSQQSNNPAMLSTAQQQFRPPAQPTVCPPDPHLQPTQTVQNGTAQQFRSTVMSPRRPTPPASGTISPMPHARTPERFASVVNHPPQSTTPHSQGFASPRPLMSPSGQMSPVPNTQQTSLQQLEQMVMPGPKVADKPDVGLYSQITPIPSANIRNGTSPSFGMNHSTSQHQNLSRPPNMDNLGHGLSSSMMPAVNPPQNTYANNGHPVPPSAASSSQMSMIHELKTTPSSLATQHKDNCLPVSSSSNNNHPCGPIQVVPPPSSSIFDNVTSNVDHKSVNDSNILLNNVSPELSNLTPRVPPVSESQNTLPMTTSTSVCASPTITNTQPSLLTSPRMASTPEVSEVIPPMKKSPLVMTDNVNIQMPLTTPTQMNSLQQPPAVASESTPDVLSQQQLSMVSTCVPQPPVNAISESSCSKLPTLVSDPPTATNRITPHYGQTHSQISPQMHSTIGATSPGNSQVHSVTATVPQHSTTSQLNVTTIQSPTFTANNQRHPQSVSPMVSPLPIQPPPAEIAQPSQPQTIHPTQALIVNQPVLTPAGPPQIHLGASPIRGPSPNQQHFMPTLTHSNSPPTLSTASTQLTQANVLVSGPPQLSLADSDFTTPTNTVIPPVPEFVLTPQQKAFEVQQLQSKIQNLCTMPPTPLINQQIAEIQERIRVLQKDQTMAPLASAPVPPQQTPPPAQQLVFTQDSQPQQSNMPQHNQVLNPLDENQTPETATAPVPAVKEKKPRKRKERTPKAPKEPKEPKAPKSPRTPKRPSKRKKVTETTPEGESTTPAAVKEAGGEAGGEDKGEGQEKAEGEDDSKDGAAKSVKRKTGRSPKGRSARPRSRPGSGKKKPLKIPIIFGKKKKKRRGSDNSDGEGTPPASPKSEDDSVQKRRSTRNTKRKKYVDDIDMNLIDDESGGDNKDDDNQADAVLIKPTQFYKSVAEDEMVVERIFNHRTGTRIVEYDDDDDEDEEGKAKDEKTKELVVVDAKEGKVESIEVDTEQKTKEPASQEVENNKSLDVKSEEQNCDKKNTADDLKKLEKTVKVENNEVNENDKSKEIAPDKTDVPHSVVKTEAPDEPKLEGSIKVETESSVEAKAEVSGEAKTEVSGEIKTEISGDTKTEVSGDTRTEVSGEAKTEASCTPKTEGSDEAKIDGKSDKKVHTETIEVQEFYVKFKNFSYLHCEWRSLDELEKGDKRIRQKLKRYWQKRAQSSLLEDLEEEPFNPLYLEVDRVLDMSEGHETETGPSQRHFLVKWQGLPYEESTWELEQDVDQDKIQQYLKFKDPPNVPEIVKTRKHLKASEWTKLGESSVYKSGNKLREYQLEGVNWLSFCTYKGQNCILADEMGLGKTIQSITYLIEIRKCGLLGPYLVIAPLSTISNWQREFDSWSDMNVIVYHGSTASRNMIQEYEMFYKDGKGKKKENVYKFEVMITTFEIVITDVMELREIPWKCCIIDEAHRLKNKNCKLLEGLRLIEMDQRVLLTGTPLQNNVEELFSLLNFLEPARFSSQESFLLEFGDLKTEGQVEKLQSILKPMMLRRLKEDVEKSLAPKQETIVEVELTNVQKKYYRAILERNFTFLAKGSNSNANVPNLMNTMMELRKCCIHPYLITGAEDQIIREYKQRHEDDEDIMFNAMVHASGKLVLLDKLLPKLKDGGHRVLIFSQMVRCLDLLEDYLVQKRYLYERIDGRVRGNMRQAAIDRFSRPDSDRFAFLLCTRAGGLGINLTAADTVVIFDSDWNPQNDLQAQARCHRIGQVKAVKIYRLICRNTYEREMFDKASLKLGLDKAVLQSMNSSNKEGITQSQPLSKKEIEDLLKKGAYGALMEDDNAGDQFCEEDIDQILQRRTQVITLEAGVKGSKFAKASFSSSDNRTDININDPEFWQKWAKKADMDLDQMDGKNELIMKEPRRRTQTRRYGNEDHLMELSELESSDDDSEAGSRGRGGRLKKGKKGRGREDEMYSGDYVGIWNRAECVKVERGLMTYGWGRWTEIMHLSYFKNNVTEKNIEDISRAILLYCSKYFHGDDQIKSFILDLITPVVDGQIRLHKNHSVIQDEYFQHGLSAPVARGRKSKKSKKDKQFSDIDEMPYNWPGNDKIDMEIQFSDINYKKHLQKRANRVLLRVRTLFYIKQEVIGNLMYQIRDGARARDLMLPQPQADGEPPAPWWDEEADKSLLVGIFKHGYERYNLIRQDPTLCFILRCGPPDGNELLAELNKCDEDFMDVEKSSNKDELDDEAMSPPASPINPNSEPSEPSEPIQSTPVQVEPGMAVFPSVAELNTRFRRLVTCYQRNHKKMEIRMAQKAKRLEKREKIEAAFREREFQKRQSQQRWSRREESDFYKTVSAFGVVYLVDQNKYDWSKFKTIARLDKKFDDTLTEYYKAFYAMCKRVCGKKLTMDEDRLPLMVEPITEERASRCLQRIDLLNNLRENIICHPKLDERLKLCQPSMDLPDWWICGRHDKDLLKGCAKHGLHRTDFHMLHDPTLCFREVIKNLGKMKSEQEAAAAAAAANAAHAPYNDKEGKDLLEKKSNEPEHVKEENKDETSKADKDNEELTTDSNPLKSVAKEEPVESNQDSQMEAKDEKKSDDSMDDDSKPPKLDIAEGALHQGEDKPECEVETKPELDKEEEIPTGPKEEQKVKEKTQLISEKEDCIEGKCKPDLKEESDDKVDLKEKDEDKDKCALNEKDDDKVENKQEQKSEAVDESTDDKTDSKAVKSDEEDNKTEGEMSCAADDKPVQNDVDDTKKSQVEVASTADTDIDLDRADVMSQDSTTTNTPINNNNGLLNNDDALSQSSFSLDLDGCEPTVAQLIHTTTTNSNSVRWPKDKVLQMRLEHVCHAVDKNEWPSPRQIYMSYATAVPSNTVVQQTSAISSRSPTPSLTRSSTPQQDHRQQPTTSASSMVDQHYRALLDPLKHHELFGLSAMAQLDQYAMSIKQNQDNLNNMNMHRKRGKKRRRNESDTEKAKLRMLLSHSFPDVGGNSSAFSRQMEDMRRNFTTLDPNHLSTMVAAAAASSLQPPPMKPSKQIRKDSSNPSTHTPPPAHQHSSKVKQPTLAAAPSGTLDLSKKPVDAHSSKSQASSSFGSGAMDLSSGSNASIKSAGMSLLKSNSKSVAKSSSGSNSASGGPSIVNGEISTARSKPSIDDLALNLQYKKRKKLKEETMKMSETKKEETKKKGSIAGVAELGEVFCGNKSGASHLGLSQLEAAAQYLSKPVGYPHSTSAANLLSEYKFAAAANFPYMTAAVGRNMPSGGASQANDRSNSPAEAASDYLESKRRKRKQKVDPQLLDINEVTGDENISVVNRLTGKRLTGSKAPTLRELSLWLEQNPMFDVEAKWSQVVKEKGKLPESLKQRLVSPADKKKKLGIYSDFTSPLLGSAAGASNLLSPPTTNNIAAMSAALGMGSLPLLSGFPGMKGASAAGGGSSGGGSSNMGAGSSGGNNSGASSVANNSSSPMFLPFGGLANLGLAANPFFNLTGYGFPNISNLAAAAAAGVPPEGNKSGMSSRGSMSKLSSEKKSSGNNQNSSSSNLHKSSHSKSRKSGGSNNAPSAAAAAAAANSMPFLFPSPNLLYNPMALSNFNLSQNLPTSFAASLAAQTGLLNSLVTPSSATTSVSSANSASFASSPMFASTKPSSANLPSASSTAPSTLASHPLMQHPDYSDDDDESLKSLMGNHDDDDFPDDDEFDDLPPSLPVETTSKKSETTKKSDTKRDELPGGGSSGKDSGNLKDSNSTKDTKSKSGSNS